MEELYVVGRDHSVSKQVVSKPVEQLVPVGGVEQHDWKVQHLAGLNQRQRLEELVGGPESARKDDEALRRLHEHRLTRIEVTEGKRDVEVPVRELLVRELDVEAHGQAATLFRATVRRLHDTGTAAGDDGPPTLCEAARDVPCLFVGRLSLAHACGAEDRDRRTVDLVDRFEPHAKFLRDALDVILDLRSRLVGREDALVLHATRPRYVRISIGPLPIPSPQKLCGTCVACMPKTSAAARAKYTSPMISRR